MGFFFLQKGGSKEPPSPTDIKPASPRFITNVTKHAERERAHEVSQLYAVARIEYEHAEGSGAGSSVHRSYLLQHHLKTKGVRCARYTPGVS